MSKGTESAKKIITLSYFHRYGWIILMAGLSLIIPKLTLYIVSSGFIIFSLWSLLGYKLKWRHVYCSFQNTHRKPMTPHNICWSKIKKIEAYGGPCIFFILGLAMICVAILS